MREVCPEIGVRSISIAQNASILSMANSKGMVYVYDLGKEPGGMIET